MPYRFITVNNVSVSCFGVDTPNGPVYLTPGERFVEFERVERRQRGRIASADVLRHIGGLTHAPSDNGPLFERLGTRGPLVASRTVDPSQPAIFAAGFCRDYATMANALGHARVQREFVRYFAPYVGRRNDSMSHEELGKLPHEVRLRSDPRRAELERLGMVFPDYGTIDGTPLFVLAVLNQVDLDPTFGYEEATHWRDGTKWTHLTSATEGLNLLERWRTANCEGLIEADAYAGFLDSFPYWKDNPDSYSHRNGALADPPASSIEVMMYAYNAFSRAADLQRRKNVGWDANALDCSARDLKRTILSEFVVNDDPRGLFVALGTDRDPLTGRTRQLKIRTSNMGLLLGADFMRERDMQDLREAIVTQMFSDVLLKPAGVLSLATDEVWFSPNGYHTGSSWPKDTFEFAQYLVPYYPRLAETLCKMVINSCRYFMSETLPGTDETSPTPNEWNVWTEMTNVYGKRITRRKERVSEEMQGWTASAVWGAKDLLSVLVRVPDGCGHADNARFEKEVLSDVASRGEFFARATMPPRQLALA